MDVVSSPFAREQGWACNSGEGWEAMVKATVTLISEIMTYLTHTPFMPYRIDFLVTFYRSFYLRCYTAPFIGVRTQLMLH